jgi:hypothetical protein
MADAVGLAAAFERAIGDADDLADRRDAESVRLATIAGLENAVANLRIGIEQAERRLAKASRAHREGLDAWTSLTASLGLNITPEPADLPGFVAERLKAPRHRRHSSRHRSRAACASLCSSTAWARRLLSVRNS